MNINTVSIAQYNSIHYMILHRFENRMSIAECLPEGMVRNSVGCCGDVEASRMCLIESSHLVLGRPVGVFQPWSK